MRSVSGARCSSAAGRGSVIRQQVEIPGMMKRYAWDGINIWKPAGRIKK
jgi:hypothetical protein